MPIAYHGGMARPHYHRDLLGTVLALAGVTFFVGSMLMKLDWPVPLTVVVATALVGITFVIAATFERLTIGETALAAALALLLLAGAHRVNVGTIAIARLALIVVVGMACAALGTWLARRFGSRWRPRIVIAGAIGMGAIGVVAIAVFSVLGRTSAGLGAIAMVAGALAGGALAVLLVPEVRPRDTWYGQWLAMSVLTVVNIAVVHDKPLADAAGAILGCAILAAAAPIAARIAVALRARRIPEPEVPEARLR
jgi:hypothetical protein